MRLSVPNMLCVITLITTVQPCLMAAEAAELNQRAVSLPDGAELVEVDFERHVAGLFSRLGCNAAACHGSFQGKGGFRLSLFGQSPALDHAAVLGGEGTTRVDMKAPEESLLLAKPSGREPHEGGLRLPSNSWEYQLIRKWIESGARRIAGRGKVEKLRIEPAELPPFTIGQTIRLNVIAEFANGDRQDVTAFSEFRCRNDAIAVTDSTGHIAAKSSGDTSVVISYCGSFLGVPIIVPYPKLESITASSITHNWIDDEVNARLASLNLIPSPPTDNAEFLRRLTIDVIGQPPTPTEVLRFLSDTDPNKRSIRIDALLSHPRRAAYWATRMCDITACNVDHLGGLEELRPKRAKMWHDWFRKRFTENQSYDQIVYGILCASSRKGKDQPIDNWIDTEAALEKAAQASFETNYRDRPSLDYFWRRVGPNGPLPVEDLAELTATAFLGIRLHCARCHQHPYDHWTQHDFAGYANVFSRVEFGSSTQLRTAINERLEGRRKARQEGQNPPELPRIQEVFLSPIARPLIDSLTSTPCVPKAPGGPDLSDHEDAREALFHWLKRPDNPYFAANFVNRVWARYFGAGLVEPVDAFSASNPATHPRLLKRLSQEFIQSGYDIRQLERLILSSATYQRSARPTVQNAADHRNFAHASVRPLLAEVLIDTLNSALEATDQFGNDIPSGSQAIELAPNRFADPNVNELFRVLGRGDRKALCECNRAPGPSIRQPLFLMSDTRVNEKIKTGRLSRLLDQQANDDPIVTEFYLATLSRNPDADELEFARQHISTSGNRTEGLADIVWALINSREFSTNH